ncbi:MAG: cytoplasmic protein [Desulfobacterales bacterium]|jgi:hypothetical protein|nr:cytoplasmic protein [Desulfobacterales bacterium]
MSEKEETLEFKLDRNNLFVEETFTDLSGNSIMRYTPVKPDGSPDKGRRVVFLGQTNVFTPNGALPIHNQINAADLPQALKRFPEAMQQGLQRIIEEARALQQEEKKPPLIQTPESRIIVP